ncbi:MAG: hypothetical protein WCS37_00280 [Chloroflexota bacterium]|nr:hypothetical protein [Chloroflexota bacterium]
MAIAFHERRESEEQPPVKVMGGERKVTSTVERSSVPSHSRAATARKLEEVASPTPEQAEEPEVSIRRGRGGQTSAETNRIKANQEALQREERRIKEIEDMETKRDELVERLDKGAVRIEEARAKGKEVQEWEDYWIQLLRHYEQICDKLRELARA